MRVLVGKADPRSARFIARALRENAYAVDVVHTLDGVVEASQGVGYAALVLHGALGASASAQLCRFLREHQVHAPILLLGAADFSAAGDADGHLAEPFTLRQLRDQVHRLVAGGIRRTAATAAATDGGKLSWGGLALDPGMRCARRENVEVALTRKEYALLELLLLRAPRAVSHADIVAHVWDGAFAGESNLIEVYMARLRKRIDGRARAKLLHTVRGVGYRVGNAEA